VRLMAISTAAACDKCTDHCRLRSSSDNENSDGDKALTICTETQITEEYRKTVKHNYSYIATFSYLDAFLSRVSILLLTRDIDIVILSVRPSSVCLSVCLSVCP